jgi:hypothetical protein
MKKATLAVCLSVSAAHANSLDSNDQQILNDLINQSGVIANQLTIGHNFVVNVVAAAGNPSLIDAEAYREALITDTMQNAYNQSMDAFIANDFYSAQDHLNDVVDQAAVTMSQAVDNYVEAKSVIEVVTTINQRAQQVTNTAEAETLQDYAVAQGADQGITDQQQDNYNEAVQEVSTATREFATYKAASVDPHLIEHMDQFAEQYGGDMSYAQTSILPEGYIQTAYFDPTGQTLGALTHSNYFTPAYQGGSLYEDQGYGLGD